MTAIRFLISLSCVAVLSPLAIGTCLSQSAWQELIRQNPRVVDDSSFDWQERLILNVLTMEQARRYYQGTRPEELVLESGQTLAEYLAERLNPPGNVYVPLAGPCELFRVEDLLVDESLSVQVRGHCGIPEEATAVILQVKAESMGGSPRVKIWATDLPEPVEAAAEGNGEGVEDLKTSTAVVTLCTGDRCRGGELQIKGTDAAVVKAEAVGYFRPLSAADGAEIESGILLSTESSDNNFFGTGAGSSNTSGFYNSFFGGLAGNSNTTGHDNAFFGRDSGSLNTTGSSNSFFGRSAGHFNSTGYSNAFFGFQSGYENTTGHGNAFFGQDSGHSNTEGNDNSFFGSHAGAYNTTGSNNAFFGFQSGYENTTGHGNAFFGQDSGHSNTEGNDNSFFGSHAGAYNTTGSNNAFFGYQSGSSNTTGSSNAFFGYGAGYSNTEGGYNAFFGRDAGRSNTEGGSNSFFGGSAGHSNTTGWNNSFFGGGAGFSSKSGLYNSFFGWSAGYFNTTGSNNSFFGPDAGFSNTVESYNTFVGYRSDLDPGSDPATSPVTNATAIGNRAYVSKSNSMVLGSIDGVNGATASTQVGIGTTAPQRLLHIAGNNAVFRMDRSTNSAAFMLVRTDTGGGILKNFVVGVDASGVNQGEFIINDLGTAVGGPGQRRLTINNDGDVIINGDLITNAGALSFPDYVFAKDYELMPLGELGEYVQAEKHLPELPSAKEIEEQGEINVTELQLRLLQKIEELTLYTVQQEQKIENQQATMVQQQAVIVQLIEQNRLVNARLEILENEESVD